MAGQRVLRGQGLRGRGLMGRWVLIAVLSVVSLESLVLWRAQAVDGFNQGSLLPEMEGALPGKSHRLQRSRSESAIAMLERKMSASAVADGTPSGPLLGERILAFSELFQKLSRPEMLDGVRPAEGTHLTMPRGTIAKEKLVVVLVGLPARGKSYISHRLVNYLNWYGIRSKLFNVGQYRRKMMKEDDVSRADFFSAGNKDASQKREELASMVFDDLLKWLKEGGNMAIFDATNTTRERRKKVLERAMKESGVEVLFVESICTDTKVVEANLAEKVRLSPDFKGMDFGTAVNDLRKRISNYEAIYETVDESEIDKKGTSISFIKVINLSSKIIANNVHGRIARNVLTFLMNLHIVPRPIFLVRAPDPDGLMLDDKEYSGDSLGAITPGGMMAVREGEIVNEGQVQMTLQQHDPHKPMPMNPIPRQLSQDVLLSSPGAEAVVAFSEERNAVLELAGEVNVPVIRRGNVSTPCIVHYQTVDGSAKAGQHYNHSDGVVEFEAGQTRAEIKIGLLDCQNSSLPEESFTVVLSAPHPQCTVLGKKKECTVTILNDDAGLPAQLRRDWSRLRFPPASKLAQSMNAGGKAVADRLARLLADQVHEFYVALHKGKLDRLKLMRDVAELRVDNLKNEINQTEFRRSVVEEAYRLQERMAVTPEAVEESPAQDVTTANLTTTIRMKGHLYNRNLLERVLDYIELKNGTVRSVGEPDMGGSSSHLSTIVLKVQGVRDSMVMQDIIANIEQIYEMDRKALAEDGKEVAADYGFEVIEATKDVGELGKLNRQLEEKRQMLEEAEEEVIKAKKAVDDHAMMGEDEIHASASFEYPTQVFTSTATTSRETGERCFVNDGHHEEISNLNMVDIGACHGMTLADLYDSMGKDSVRQFLTQPYIARVPGGESLRDVVHRVEPFVVDHIERQRSACVVVSHLSTLQVLYQYFVGASSRLPFWKLHIPRGSVIQLVPHLFGFEERRFSFKQECAEPREADNDYVAVHMASHWVG